VRWTEKSSVPFGRVVARRVLTEVGFPDRQITLSLGMPRRVDREEWQCPILIEGLEDYPIADSAPGVDSLAALLLGVECIRWHLKRSKRRFAWLGDTELMGSGIPRQVPTGFGKQFDERIERAIEREARNTHKVRSKILRGLLAHAESNLKATKEAADRRLAGPAATKKRQKRKHC
jgi:Domain of unknown function (DUF6968)